MSILNIKTEIKELLDELVTATVLAGATITDIRKDPLYADHPNFPHAYLMPPAIETEGLDNRTNIRKYTFDILIVFNGENLTGTTQLETAIEAVLDKFDNKPTLNGSAIGGMTPLTSAPIPYQHNSKDLLAIAVRITAQEVVTLTF